MNGVSINVHGEGNATAFKPLVQKAKLQMAELAPAMDTRHAAYAVKVRSAYDIPICRPDIHENNPRRRPINNDS